MLRSLFCLLVLAALAAGCGGGGGGGGSNSPTLPVLGASKIFVGDSANGAIGSSANSNPSPGTLVVDRIITGANTKLDTSLFDFALDTANDQLYVTDLRSILVFNGASTATGNVAPARTVSTIPGGLGGYNGGLYLDTAGNRLYAGTNVNLGGPQTIQVFDSASTASAATPTRNITITTNFIFDIAVDTTRDILYVYDNNASNFTQIAVFDSASTLNGTVAPSRTISLVDSGGGGPIGLFIDAANDRLYVPRNVGTISVFDIVHSATDAVPASVVPSRTINLPVPTYSAVFVELSSNRLYAVDANGVNIIANASTVTGTPLATTRVIAPAGSSLQAIAVKP